MGVDANAFGGFQLVWREMKAAGLDPHADLATLQFAGYPMQRIVDAVRRGDTDAGIVRACLLEDLVREGQARADEFRVLMPKVASPAMPNAVAPAAEPCARSTPLYPDWPFAALRDTPNDLAKRVATALLSMPAAADGHAWTVPTDYQPVRELFRELEIGPYADLRERSLAGFIRRHWMWLVLAVAALLGWAMHSLRVAWLVDRRTAQLRQALADQARLEREARLQQDKLDHLSRLGVLGEMSSMLAHELNQPLSAIGNFARGMVRRIEAGRVEPAPLLDASRDIAEQAERAAGIMQRVRGFVGKRGVQRERLDLKATLEGAIELFRSVQTTPPAIELRVDSAAHGGPWVRADRLQVEQLLLNLMKNALDAMAAVPADERRIGVHAAPDGEMYRIGVVDNGCGVSLAAFERLFEPFFTTKVDGVGLGLAICRRVAEAHGGRLWAEPNAPGPGLTVWFTLPSA